MLILFSPFRDLWAKNLESQNSGPPQKAKYLYLSCISNGDTKKDFINQSQTLLKVILK